MINGGIIESHTKLVYLDGVVKAIINGGKLISQTSDAIFSANSVLDINGGDIAGSNALFLFGHVGVIAVTRINFPFVRFAFISLRCFIVSDRSSERIFC